MLKKSLRIAGFVLLMIAALLAAALGIMLHDAYSIPCHGPGDPCDGPGMLSFASTITFVCIDIPIAAAGAWLLYFTRAKRS